MSEGDRLLAIVRATGDSEASHSLLNEFFSGYSLENLRTLLRSDEEKSVRAGVWIASELGDRCSEVLEDMRPLLHHASRYVRFFAVDCILLAAEPWQTDLLGSAAGLVWDEDAAVRWKALTFLTNTTVGQLLGAAHGTVEPWFSAELEWLASLGPGDSEAVRMRLGSSKSTVRRLGAAAAARLAASSIQLLELASANSDPDVASFAAEQLALGRIKRSKKAK